MTFNNINSQAIDLSDNNRAGDKLKLEFSDVNITILNLSCEECFSCRKGASCFLCGDCFTKGWTELDFSSELTSIETINISGHNIKEMDLAIFKNTGVRYLDLSKNELVKLRLSDDIPTLEKLNISNQGEDSPPMQMDENFGEPFWLQKLVTLDVDSDTKVPEILKRKLDALKNKEIRNDICE